MMKKIVHWLMCLVRLLLGLPMPKKKFPSQVHAPDLVKGYWVEKDVEFTDLSHGFKFLPLLEEGKEWICHLGMFARAKDLNANLGLLHAKWLCERPHLVPDEFSEKILLFPGTVLEKTTLAGYTVRLIPVLDRDQDGKLFIDFRTLGNFTWNADAFLVSPK